MRPFVKKLTEATAKPGNTSTVSAVYSALSSAVGAAAHAAKETFTAVTPSTTLSEDNAKQFKRYQVSGNPSGETLHAPSFSITEAGTVHAAARCDKGATTRVIAPGEALHATSHPDIVRATMAGTFRGGPHDNFFSSFNYGPRVHPLASHPNGAAVILVANQITAADTLATMSDKTALAMSDPLALYDTLSNTATLLSGDNIDPTALASALDAHVTGGSNLGFFMSFSARWHPAADFAKAAIGKQPFTLFTNSHPATAEKPWQACTPGSVIVHVDNIGHDFCAIEYDKQSDDPKGMDVSPGLNNQFAWQDELTSYKPLDPHRIVSYSVMTLCPEGKIRRSTVRTQLAAAYLPRAFAMQSAEGRAAIIRIEALQQDRMTRAVLALNNYAKAYRSGDYSEEQLQRFYQQYMHFLNDAYVEAPKQIASQINAFFSKHPEYSDGHLLNTDKLTAASSYDIQHILKQLGRNLELAEPGYDGAHIDYNEHRVTLTAANGAELSLCTHDARLWLSAPVLGHKELHSIEQLFTDPEMDIAKERLISQMAEKMDADHSHCLGFRERETETSVTRLKAGC